MIYVLTLFLLTCILFTTLYKIMSNTLNILFIGDVVGNPGMKAVRDHLPIFIEKYEPDLVVINGENAADGKGITETESKQLFLYGADVITSGNHVWDNWKGKPLLSTNQKILRPLNYPPGNPGLGFCFHQIDDNLEVAVLNLQGRTFMQTIDCPFRAADFALGIIEQRTKIILVDFHAEATAEKIAMGWHLNGRVSAVVGTHTHIQTNDARILSEGTAYISDVGMTGPYDSVVGLKKDIALKRFMLQTPFKFEMAEKDSHLCGAFIKVDRVTSKSVAIESFIYPKW